MNKYTNDTVLSFPTLTRWEKLTVKEVVHLVKCGELEKVTSKIFKIPAITKASYVAYLDRQRKKVELLYKEEESISTQEVMKLLELRGLSTVSGLCRYGKFRRIKSGFYSKKEVLEYKKLRDKEGK